MFPFFFESVVFSAISSTSAGSRSGLLEEVNVKTDAEAKSIPTIATI
jgi:hypothetical protein